MNNNHYMEMLTPASNWRDAVPCGNGPMCAMVYGGISPETILFNHDSLWYGAKRTAVPDISEFLPELRELAKNGELEKANDLYPERLRERGFSGQLASLHPAFDLKIQMRQNEAFKNYRRILDFSTGQITVSWEDENRCCRREFFVSRARKNLAMLRIRRDRGSINAGFALCEHNLTDLIDMAGIAQKLIFNYETRVEQGMLVLSASGSDGGDFGAVMRVHAPGGAVGAEYSASWTQQLTSLAVLWGWHIPDMYRLAVDNADEIIAATAMYVNEPREIAVPRLLDQLASLDMNYDNLFTEHCEKHSTLFNRCLLELAPDASEPAVNANKPAPDADRPAKNADKPVMYADKPAPISNANEELLLRAYQGNASALLLNKLYDMGRYLLISCSSEDSNPPTLQGTWNGDYYPPWNSFYVHNENTQMFYWQALPGSIPEVVWAMFNYFERFLDDYRENARKLYGCRGIFIPLTADAGTGLLQDAQPHVVYFTGVAPWISQHFYDYWLFTRDNEFLKNHAWPFIRECALFYTDFLEIDACGQARMFPSNSPENAPGNSLRADFDGNLAMNPGIPLTINSTVDIALAREVFTNALCVAGQLGIDEPEIARWRELLDALPAYRINQDGALAEWIYPGHSDNYAHRHLSHIYPLFPGFQITKEQPDLFKSVHTAMEKRMSMGLEALTGWSLVHQANIYSRMGDGERAVNCLDILCRTCLGKNFLTYHNDNRNMGVTLNLLLNLYNPYQADAIMGVAGAVTEMLCYSYPGTLRLLPALPAHWKKGRFGAVATRDAVKLYLDWDMDAVTLRVSMEAGAGVSFKLELPDIFNRPVETVNLQKGEQKEFVFTV